MNIDTINKLTENVKKIREKIDINNITIEEHKTQIAELRNKVNIALKENCDLLNTEKLLITDLHKETYNLYAGTQNKKYPPGLPIPSEIPEKNIFSEITCEKFTKKNTTLILENNLEKSKEKIEDKEILLEDKENVWENKDKIKTIKDSIVKVDTTTAAENIEIKKKTNIFKNEKADYFKESIYKLNTKYCAYGKRCKNELCNKNHNTCFFYHRYGQCLAGFYCTHLHIDELLLDKQFNRKNYDRLCLSAKMVVCKYGSLRNQADKNPSMEYYPLRTMEQNNLINKIQPF